MMPASSGLDFPGAVELEDGQDLDACVPAHFSQPLREQDLLRRGRAATLLARDVVAVSGPDRLTWLTTLGSQILSDISAGDGGRETLLLDAQGHIRHALSAVDDGECLFLVTDVGRGEDLVAFLDSMRFMLRVEVAARPDLCVFGAFGAGVSLVEELARREDAFCATWRDPWPGVVEGGTSYDVGLTDFVHPGRGWDAGSIILQRQASAAVASSLPGMAGSLAWEALRVEAGRPRAGRDVDERTIPGELDWLRTAVHLTKGCYPGQETIARTVNLGRVPRRAVILQLDGLAGDLPPHGACVRMGEREVGRATTVVRHHEYGPMALAVIRRNVPLDAALSVDVDAEQGHRVAAAQEPLVSVEGKSQASPAQRPGAGLRAPSVRVRPPADRVER